MIDAHGHISDPRLDAISEQLIDHLRRRGLKQVILGGVGPDEWLRQESIKKRYPDFIVPAIGIHPWTVRDTLEADLENIFSQLEQSASRFPIIGEVGVDFYRSHAAEEKIKQAHWCERQLDLAARLGKPVVLHVVRGHDVMLQALQKRSGLRGLIHGFTGSAHIASAYQRFGFIPSLGVRSIQRRTPTDFAWLKKSAFVIESDAPSNHLQVVDAEILAESWIQDLNSVAAFLGKLWAMDPQGVWELSDQNLSMTGLRQSS